MPAGVTDESNHHSPPPPFPRLHPRRKHDKVCVGAHAVRSASHLQARTCVLTHTNTHQRFHNPFLVKWLFQAPMPKVNKAPLTPSHSLLFSAILSLSFSLSLHFLPATLYPSNSAFQLSLSNISPAAIFRDSTGREAILDLFYLQFPI